MRHNKIKKIISVIMLAAFVSPSGFAGSIFSGYNSDYTLT